MPLLLVLEYILVCHGAWAERERTAADGFYYPTGAKVQPYNYLANSCGPQGKTSLGKDPSTGQDYPTYKPNWYHVGQDILFKENGLRIVVGDPVYAIAAGVVLRRAGGYWGPDTTKNGIVVKSIGLVVEHTLSGRGDRYS
ncbi:MAG: hypothetical protein A3C85_00735 [Candidatus Doudnabacteria bacterium RIFCSPHIGHO2_02_FULL_48_21]|nr:MAG: hypothetical protein A3K05_04725 [Candidatus Doudnabacteria bacterium RIFCSPHIGHO2_01_48_18]OGE77289.1 MAG: hypothetical protein A2668_02575 [Candidatus Doudnabacteria bacterium RIFCSPHIGHO2_01_FULL_48_180]OGE91030.1 MAG: hypothetical protein A3F44_01755 [Candidatus Doudnabacteria bacterium RIFCSPHIGHO2_12_FULL_47_25]OGE92829.1 MAG: hypothetical protein A3C85_00735 [Candidatus Doudnabacteria bacterium RIFCSPHIGHO2_02_FULL_48_21]OGE96860.1 MAG: hypothetical protein A3A83_03970 [Candidatu